MVGTIVGCGHGGSDQRWSVIIITQDPRRCYRRGLGGRWTEIAGAATLNQQLAWAWVVWWGLHGG